MSRPRACLVDLDGTLYEGGEPVPGAAEAVARLRAAEFPFRFVTNTTRRPRSAVVASLADMGIGVGAEEVATAPVAAARHLADAGVRRIDALLPEATFEDFAAAGLEVAREGVEAVVVGDLGEGWDFAVLNRAFRSLLDGARLVAVHKNRFWRAADGPSLDAGPFVAALEHAAGVEATLVGKPSRAFFAAVLAGLGVEPADAAMAGDDLVADVEGARAAGLTGIAVRTGKMRHDRSGVEPDVVLDSIADLPGWLGID